MANESVPLELFGTEVDGVCKNSQGIKYFFRTPADSSQKDWDYRVLFVKTPTQTRRLTDCCFETLFPAVFSGSEDMSLAA